MFTGLVEAIGRVAKVSVMGSIVRLQIEAPFSGELKKGQSVCVSGACLTVVDFNSANFTVEVMNETVKRTKFGALVKNGRGAAVNLERALRAGDRLDGHFVLGHVDGEGVISGLHDGGAGRYVAEIEAPPEIMFRIVSKGSVALDGVSLTIIDVSRSRFSVGIIPATLANSTFGQVRVGDKINIETDILGKYIQAKIYDVLKEYSNFTDIVREYLDEKDKDKILLEKLTEMGW